MIYLDNAATTLRKPQCVIDAVAAALNSMGNASRGAHSGALSASRVVYDTRCKLAKLFGCGRPDHVVFTSNSTEALNIALNGIFSPGDHVITTDLEHNSVLRPLYRLEKEGIISLDFVPADRQGRPDYSAFENLIRDNTRAIVCTHASNLTGNMIDLTRVGEIAQTHGLLLVVDASQTAGAVPIDMEAMHIDILCFTGHKGLMAPQGTGGLCIREGVEIRPFKVGGSGVHSYDKEQPSPYPTRLEAGTLNSHGIAGLSASLDYVNQIGVDAIRAKEESLMRRFYEGVSKIDGVAIYGDFESERTAVVTLNIGDEDSAIISDALYEDYGIATRPGAHCAPRMHEALGTTEQGAVRFSFSWFNTEEEVDEAIRAVAELAE
ncbi:MAG: aminotransferase class V-fold PLP-dependent enzyme [Oscillospiraceae bacterium]|nr:aminotransferase class V-fold PLP-dependent enzyme [Oscillospiraceae bacterium]MBQ9148513.1 aminotransferase class V-fold PLP-dependent enzyme [Oscillospiraceae bacterium]